MGWSCIRQHHLEHTSAYVSIREHTSGVPGWDGAAYVSITSSIRQHTSAYVSIRQDYLDGMELEEFEVHLLSTRILFAEEAKARVAGRPAAPHTSAYVSIRQHTSAYEEEAKARVAGRPE